ncbi:MAG: VOC family protein [Pyrinomonadaceae bacterium]
MKIDRIRQIAVYAEDIDAAISFYNDILGATFLAKYDPPGLAFFDFSGTRLLLEKTAQKSTVYFWVEDIDAAFTKLQTRGVKFIDTPHLIFRDESGVFGTPSEEEWMTFFTDPSGNTLALATRKTAND